MRTEVLLNAIRTPEDLKKVPRERLPRVAAELREMIEATSSERQGRLIDQDEEASMEAKKREGYF